ncbi:hypothetical protein QOZ80_6BG0498460 [Eleusine coracana subsp. coracana]|nr:hypothetical protein QOZ80_6BG0498460 [Eleusine coracana subsp. coracana]
MDVYGFALTKEQGSAGAVWIHGEGDGAVSNVRAIMTGWDVLPIEYGDSKTHFYTKWTDGPSGDWLVYCGLDRAPELIGRFPRSLFTGGFEEKATSIAFGGVVTGPKTNPPPMASGYLPTETSSTASISNIQLVDKDGRAWPVTEDLLTVVTNRDAYAVTPIVNGKFYYGGHGLPKA